MGVENILAKARLQVIKRAIHLHLQSKVPTIYWRSVPYSVRYSPDKILNVNVTSARAIPGHVVTLYTYTSNPMSPGSLKFIYEIKVSEKHSGEDMFPVTSPTFGSKILIIGCFPQSFKPFLSKLITQSTLDKYYTFLLFIQMKIKEKKMNRKKEKKKNF